MGDSSQMRVTSVAGAVGDEDFVRFEPPADLWARIAASISSPPSAPLGTVVEYWIDADDVVSTVGDGWSEFARDNEAPELADLTTDRTLWSHFDSDEVRDLWREVVARVRTRRVTATVPLRCDGPDTRRWFEMTITPGADDTVWFRSELVREEVRPAVPFLSVAALRDRALDAVPVCSWCGDGHDGSEWVDIERLVRGARLLEATEMPALAHGICPSCREAMSADLLVGVERVDQ